MRVDERHTDGNALAGVLAELFGEDVSVSPRRCESCRQIHMVGEHVLYEGAGFVLRCPGCGDVAAMIVTRADGYAVTMRGTWLLKRET
jgi:hypothetical protein